MRTSKINKQKIQELYDSGLSVKEIADDMRISEQTVYKKIKLDNTRNKFGPKNIDIVEAQKLYDGGLSIRKLAEHYGVMTDTILRLNIKTRDISEAMSLELSTRIWTDDGLKSLSDCAKKRGLGGYRPHPNKGQMYKEIWFDSKWEVVVAKSLDENNIEWIRPKIGFVWTDDGKKYYPDFYLPEYDVYLDPKNPYLMIKDKPKIDESQKRNGISVLLLSEEQLNWNTIKNLIMDSKQ